MSTDIPDPCHEQEMALAAIDAELVDLLVAREPVAEALRKCREAHPWIGTLLPDWIYRMMPQALMLPSYRTLIQSQARSRELMNLLISLRGQRK